MNFFQVILGIYECPGRFLEYCTHYYFEERVDFYYTYRNFFYIVCICNRCIFILSCHITCILLSLRFLISHISQPSEQINTKSSFQNHQTYHKGSFYFMDKFIALLWFQLTIFRFEKDLIKNDNNQNLFVLGYSSNAQ